MILKTIFIVIFYTFFTLSHAETLEEASIILENDINSLNCEKSFLKIAMYMQNHISIVEQYTVNDHEKNHLLNVLYRSLENSEDKVRECLKQNITDDVYIQIIPVLADLSILVIELKGWVYSTDTLIPENAAMLVRYTKSIELILKVKFE